MPERALKVDVAAALDRDRTLVACKAVRVERRRRLVAVELDVLLACEKRRVAAVADLLGWRIGRCWTRIDVALHRDAWRSAGL